MSTPAESVIPAPLPPPVPVSKVRLFFRLAATRLTTYLALGVAGLAQLAEHAQDVHDALPSLMPYLPPGPLLAKSLHWITSGLALLIVYTRVRRLLAGKPP